MTSVVIHDLTEPRHPETMELWYDVRSLVADLTDQFHSELPRGTQVSRR
jgi:hypothetical protein